MPLFPTLIIERNSTILVSKMLVKIELIVLPPKFMVFLNSVQGCGKQNFGSCDLRLLMLLHGYVSYV